MWKAIIFDQINPKMAYKLASILYFQVIFLKSTDFSHGLTILWLVHLSSDHYQWQKSSSGLPRLVNAYDKKGTAPIVFLSTSHLSKIEAPNTNISFSLDILLLIAEGLEIREHPLSFFIINYAASQIISYLPHKTGIGFWLLLQLLNTHTI